MTGIYSVGGTGMIGEDDAEEEDEEDEEYDYTGVMDHQPLPDHGHWSHVRAATPEEFLEDGEIGLLVGSSPHSAMRKKKRGKHRRLSDGVSDGEGGKMVHREVILVTLGLFMGYAILVVFQHKLKQAYQIPDTKDKRSSLFTFACSFLYIGNLVFRLAHNIVFGCVKPRHRVYISLVSMMLAVGVLAVFVFGLCLTQSLAWVFIAYFLGGMAVGTFESNLLSAITPLGHSTKVWAILGMPIGFACVTIGGFFLSALGAHPITIYFLVLAALVAAICVFFFRIPVVDIANNGDSFAAFAQNLRDWREWLPKLKWNALALFGDMFCVSVFSGVMLYILNGPKVPLFGVHSTTLMGKDWYFVLFNAMNMLGDTISRRIAYHTTLRNPLVYLVVSVAGVALCLSGIAILAPLGVFCILFANGSIYATTTKHIDQHIKREYNLVALSVWLFVGDIGSVIGSNLINIVRGIVCATHHEYVCVELPPGQMHKCVGWSFW